MSGLTRARRMPSRSRAIPDLKWPADLYLEGSDQHRGWFHSSLLESCGTRGRAPYDGVLTHGFTLDEQGRKMSKSLGNITAPQSVCDQYGADILRLWVVGTDYTEDQRIGPEILKHQAEAYRRLRNTLRYLLGSLDAFAASEKVDFVELPEARALGAASPGRAGRADAPGGRRLRLPHDRDGAQHLLLGRSLGVLFRHPQGRDLLRRARQPAPARGTHGDGGGLLFPHRVAGADHLLSPRKKRGSCGRRTCRMVGRTACICVSTRPSPTPGSTSRSVTSGRRCGRCAVS